MFNLKSAPKKDTSYGFLGSALHDSKERRFFRWLNDYAECKLSRIGKEESKSGSNSFENVLIQEFIHRKIYESWRFVFLKFEKIFIIRVSTDRIR